ncbi:hypothetical protein CYMTET_9440 [Cymbomonas tetramitiformis]|uniref:Uncharacterized protein n=1 Tax=Cymbomonas tetramitiformis TaxID=36881 RepID=A0AAE0LFG5_9CHLO|nr:hypothetical protein CYMTET_9440 [Cymbomonas tetramitiformis]
MTLAQILPDDKLRALMFSSDERIDKADSLKRVQLISLCRAQASIIAHYRSALGVSTQPVASQDPIVLNILVSEGAEVGGDASDLQSISDVSYCEAGVGDEPMFLPTRSVSSQITTTRPMIGATSSGSSERQAPPVRIERHYYHEATQ